MGSSLDTFNEPGQENVGQQLNRPQLPSLPELEVLVNSEIIQNPQTTQDDFEKKLLQKLIDQGHDKFTAQQFIDENRQTWANRFESKESFNSLKEILDHLLAKSHEFDKRGAFEDKLWDIAEENNFLEDDIDNFLRENAHLISSKFGSQRIKNESAERMRPFQDSEAEIISRINLFDSVDQIVESLKKAYDPKYHQALQLFIDQNRSKWTQLIKESQIEQKKSLDEIAEALLPSITKCKNIDEFYDKFEELALKFGYSEKEIENYFDKYFDEWNEKIKSKEAQDNAERQANLERSAENYLQKIHLFDNIDQFIESFRNAHKKYPQPLLEKFIRDNKSRWAQKIKENQSTDLERQNQTLLSLLDDLTQNLDSHSDFASAEKAFFKEANKQKIPIKDAQDFWAKNSQKIQNHFEEKAEAARRAAEEEDPRHQEEEENADQEAEAAEADADVATDLDSSDVDADSSVDAATDNSDSSTDAPSLDDGPQKADKAEKTETTQQATQKAQEEAEKKQTASQKEDSQNLNLKPTSYQLPTTPTPSAELPEIKSASPQNATENAEPAALNAEEQSELLKLHPDLYPVELQTFIRRFNLESYLNGQFEHELANLFNLAQAYKFGPPNTYYFDENWLKSPDNLKHHQTFLQLFQGRENLIAEMFTLLQEFWGSELEGTLIRPEENTEEEVAEIEELALEPTEFEAVSIEPEIETATINEPEIAEPTVEMEISEFSLNEELSQPELTTSGPIDSEFNSEFNTELLDSDLDALPDEFFLSENPEISAAEFDSELQPLEIDQEHQLSDLDATELDEELEEDQEAAETDLEESLEEEENTDQSPEQAIESAALAEFTAFLEQFLLTEEEIENLQNAFPQMLELATSTESAEEFADRLDSLPPEVQAIINQQALFDPEFIGKLFATLQEIAQSRDQNLAALSEAEDEALIDEENLEEAFEEIDEAAEEQETQSETLPEVLNFTQEFENFLNSLDITPEDQKELRKLWGAFLSAIQISPEEANFELFLAILESEPEFQEILNKCAPPVLESIFHYLFKTYKRIEEEKIQFLMSSFEQTLEKIISEIREHQGINQPDQDIFLRLETLLFATEQLLQSHNLSPIRQEGLQPETPILSQKTQVSLEIFYQWALKLNKFDYSTLTNPELTLELIENRFEIRPTQISPDQELISGIEIW